MPTATEHIGPAPLSEAAEQHMVPMRDGAELATDVYVVGVFEEGRADLAGSAQRVARAVSAWAVRRAERKVSTGWAPERP